jgi:hypothetical protein
MGNGNGRLRIENEPRAGGSVEGRGEEGSLSEAHSETRSEFLEDSIYFIIQNPDSNPIRPFIEFSWNRAWVSCRRRKSDLAKKGREVP